MPPVEKFSIFPNTRWTVVRRMGDGREEVRLQGWAEFYETYWPALTGWLKGRGVDSPDAQDLVQGFLERLWKSEDFTERLSPEGGKLRSFLLKSLLNWQRERFHHETRQKRGGQAVHLELDEVVVISEEDTSYDQEWARATLRRACLHLRAEYDQRGNATLFDLILPLVDSRDPGEGGIVAEKLGMTENALNVALKRLRDRLARRLRTEVSATLVRLTSAQVDGEIRHLLGSFGQNSSLTDLVNSLSLSP